MKNDHMDYLDIFMVKFLFNHYQLLRKCFFMVKQTCHFLKTITELIVPFYHKIVLII